MDEENVTQDDTQVVESQEVTEESSPSNEHLNEEVAEDTSEQTDGSEQREEVEDNEELTSRQQKRVEQIEKKAEELKLTKILDRIQGTKQPQRRDASDPLNYREAIDAPDEVYETLDNDRRSFGEQRYNEGLEAVRAMEFRTNIKLDLPIVQGKLDKLDPADAQAIDREYLMYTGYDPTTGYVKNPDIGYADFVEAQIERAERLASNMHLKSQQNIAKQAAQTGVRPDGGGRQGIKIESAQDIAKMSDKEFEKNREAIYKAAGLTL
jgi:hypothetical protein